MNKISKIGLTKKFNSSEKNFKMIKHENSNSSR